MMLRRNMAQFNTNVPSFYRVEDLLGQGLHVSNPQPDSNQPVVSLSDFVRWMMFSLNKSPARSATL